MVNQNRATLNEADCDPSQAPKPSPQNFVQAISMLKELQELSSLDGKLKQLIPPAVSAMNDELNAILQQIVN